MSFWDDLLEALPGSIRTALSLTDTGSVYGGRRPEKIPREVSVWIEREPDASIGADGFQHVTEFPVNLHVSVRSLSDQLTALQAKMRTLVKLYNGVQPLSALTNCFTIKAEEGEIDLEDPRTLTGIVKLTFYVCGSGSPELCPCGLPLGHLPPCGGAGI